MNSPRMHSAARIASLIHDGRNAEAIDLATQVTDHMGRHSSERDDERVASRRWCSSGSILTTAKSRNDGMGFRNDIDQQNPPRVERHAEGLE